MSGKQFKRLRKFVQGLPESQLMIDTRSGQIRRGKGARRTYQLLKRAGGMKATIESCEQHGLRLAYAGSPEPKGGAHG